MQQYVLNSTPQYAANLASLAVKFSGDIQSFLADPRNVADLDAVLKGEAVIVRLNRKAN